MEYIHKWDFESLNAKLCFAEESKKLSLETWCPAGKTPADISQTVWQDEPKDPESPIHKAEVMFEGKTFRLEVWEVVKGKEVILVYSPRIEEVKRHHCSGRSRVD